MRNVVLGLGISLDGYIARPDGAVDFLFMPKGYSMAPFFATIDTAILGRKTYDAGRKMGGSFESFGMPFYVMSRTLPAGKRDGVVITKQRPAALLAQIRKKRGKKIWLMGGGEIMFRLCRRLQGGKLTAGALDGVGLILSILALAAAPCLIVLDPERSFWVADPFLGRLHIDYVFEFGNILKWFRTQSIWAGVHVFVLPLVGFVMLRLLFRTNLARPWKSLLALALCPATFMLVLLDQMR